MKTPQWYIGLALLFWGWETGLLLWALLMAAVVEGSRWITARWEFADSDLNRICDLCLVLFLAAGTLMYSTEDRLIFIFKWAQWLPFCFFPLALAQCYGERPSMPLSAFSWLLRRIPHSPVARISFNVSYGYYAICLLAASASTRADQYFYLGVSVLILMALSSVRPRRVSWQAWLVLAVAVVLTGRLSHQALRQLQNSMETSLSGWLANWFRTTTDPRECPTHIGHGAMTLSPKIVLRLRVPGGDVPPALLREGSYDSYRRGTWLAGTNQFAQVTQDRNGLIRLLPPKKIFSSVEIAAYYPNGDGLVPLPHGTFQLDDFQIGVLSTNRFGVAAVQAAPGLLDFQADYWIGPSIDSPPGPDDLGVPEDEKPALTNICATLGLANMTDRQKIRAISRFFQDNFKYSLDSPAAAGLKTSRTPLGRFLAESRWGHCEYFASATVLLLRQAGINARYITGYAVPESARHGENYIVRERHRHAWALVYHADTQNWEQIDNTPGAWAEVAEASTPWWQATSDFMSNLYFQFSKWRWGKSSISHYAQWALGPLILYLVWRILSTRRRQQKSTGGAAGLPEPVWPGLDSELYLINQRLAGMNLNRQPNEPLNCWQRRLEEAFPGWLTLESIFRMHRRLRFDPRGLPSHERQTLRRHSSEWLADFSAKLEKAKAARANISRAAAPDLRQP
ncbi:MAG TPA: transglutaminase-like domain-containing protein [Verrucomicrobiae bacterium]|jgi:transglutaminase-like putative cysteine protease